MTACVSPFFRFPKKPNKLGMKQNDAHKDPIKLPSNNRNGGTPRIFFSAGKKNVQQKKIT
jgi:hypothetical protein